MTLSTLLSALVVVSFMLPCAQNRLCVNFGNCTSVLTVPTCVAAVLQYDGLQQFSQDIERLFTTATGLGCQCVVSTQVLIRPRLSCLCCS
jgi:hypothetical protein